MKNYFKFSLTSNKIFPVWIAYMVLFLIPYIFVQYKIQGLKAQSQDPQASLEMAGSLLKWYSVMVILILIEYGILFFFTKLAIGAIQFKEKSFVFGGELGEFLKVLIPGFLLTIITIGIYSPWYMRNLLEFYSEKTSYNQHKFEFKGEGSDLFLIILFTMIIPMVFLFFIVMILAFIVGFRGLSTTADPTTITMYAALVVFIIALLAIPYVYYSNKWKINFKIKNYSIQWETSFWDSATKIAVEILLSLITIGIYAPLALLRLFKYFGERTVVKSPETAKKFGYDLEAKKDFVFIWKQILLTIITIGMYYPKAICNVGSQIIDKVYIEEI
jgi:uncharacterized membrane protein YjgN (DUF898 family)